MAARLAKHTRMTRGLFVLEGNARIGRENGSDDEADA